MANALILSQIAQGGYDPVPRPNWDQKRLAAQRIAESQQQMGQRNALFQQQQEDRQRQMQMQQQERQMGAIREDLAAYIIARKQGGPQAAQQVWAQLAPKYGVQDQDPELFVPNMIRQNPGILGPASERVLADFVAPKQPELTTDQRNAQAYASDPAFKSYMDRQKPADVANELRRIELDRRAQEAQVKRDEAAQKKQADTQAFMDQAGDSISVIDKMIGSADGTIPPHPGLSTAVGVKGITGGLLGGAVLPGTDAADFLTLYNQSKGKQFLEAFQTLKGGGQITEVEGKKATDAIARMDRSQSEEDFKKAASEFRQIIQRGLERKRAQMAVSGDQNIPGGAVSGRGFRVLGRVK